MKKIVAFLSMIGLTACASVAGPNYQIAETSELMRANYMALEKLIAASNVSIEKDIPLLVATVVNLDSLNQSSRLGRLVSEHISARLSQLGYNVVEMKLRNNVYIREGAGELLLSRDVRDLSKNHNAQVVMVGNYAVAADYVYLTLKAVTVADNRVIAATNYLLPLTENNKAMLLLQRD